jgi:hypothetical protein
MVLQLGVWREAKNPSLEQIPVPVAGSCEHGNEPSNFRKVVEFLDQLSFSCSRGASVKVVKLNIASLVLN